MLRLTQEHPQLSDMMKISGGSSYVPNRQRFNPYFNLKTRRKIKDNAISHFTRVRTQIKNKACLIKALEDLGFAGKLKISETPQHLYGFQNDQREQVAEIIIPRAAVGGAANDIGFQLQEDGTYEAIISDYDSGNRGCRKNDLTNKLTGYNEGWQKLLNAYYAKAVVEESSRNAGYYVADHEVDEDGNIYVNIDTPY